jgi:hypothetical protein
MRCRATLMDSVFRRTCDVEPWHATPDDDRIIFIQSAKSRKYYLDIGPGSGYFVLVNGTVPFWDPPGAIRSA